MNVSTKTKLRKKRCKQCGYEWYPKVINPKKCPNGTCQSWNWDKKRKTTT